MDDSTEYIDSNIKKRKLKESPTKLISSQTDLNLHGQDSHEHFSIPDGFQDVASNEDEWNEFSKTVLESEIETIQLGLVFRINSTNFRSFDITLGAYDKNDFLTEMKGLCVLIPESKDHPYYIDMSPDRIIPLTTRWNAIYQLFQTDKIKSKVCFGSKDLIKPILKKFPYINIVNMYDPQIAAWVYSTELKGGFSFENLCLHFLKEKLPQNFLMKNWMANYIHGDMILAERLMGLLETLLKKDDLWEPFIEQEMNIVPILSEMEIRGIRFDSSSLKQSREVLSNYIQDIQKKADQICGIKTNLSSPKKVADILFNKLKLEPKIKKRMSRSDNISTTELVLESIKDKHPLPGLVLSYRQADKILSNWIDSLLKKEFDGRVYSTWNQLGTATGRLSSSMPNLQNLPRDVFEKDGIVINVRSAFIPSDKSQVFISADYSQLEMRILAHFSNDPTLLSFFRKKGDVHTLVASHWKKKDVKDVTADEREKSKRLVYGIMYGMGPLSLSYHLNVSTKEAKEFLNQFLDSYKDIKQFIIRSKEESQHSGVARTLFKRRRIIDYDKNVIYDSDEMDDVISGLEDRTRQDRQAFNAIIQGTAADIVKRAMIRIHKKLGSRLKLVLQVHDELVYECNRDEVNEYINIIKHEMESVADLAAPLQVHFKIGESYGNMNPINIEEKDEAEAQSQHDATNSNINDNKMRGSETIEDILSEAE